MKRALILLLAVTLQPAALSAGPVRVGTTFSRVQAEYLDMDWEKAYSEALGMGFDIIRLGAYWGRIEKEEGTYDFSVLDRQIREAEKKGIPVVLTVGMKAPRWPEYFIPEWVLQKNRIPPGTNAAAGRYMREKTLAFIEKVVTRYRKRNIIAAWQVENEPFNRFGENDWYIGGEFLREEVALVRRLDGGRRKILLTVATYPNAVQDIFARISSKHDPLEECIALGDIVGLNVYPTVGDRIWLFDIYWTTTKRGRERYFSRLLSRINSAGKEAWITELQAEPWEPARLVYKADKKPRTGDPGTTMESFRELRGLGVDTIFLWGVEYGIFRDDNYNDNEWYGILEHIRRGERNGNLNRGRGYGGE